jgi:hypothetical protein
MHDDKVLNPASLQKDYNQQNADYIIDKVATCASGPSSMTWPTAKITRPGSTKKSAGRITACRPGGKEFTYAAAWGFAS